MLHSTETTRRIGALIPLALLLTLAALAFGDSRASASLENAGNPNVTLEVSPGDGNNLAATATLTVTGAGFQSGGFGTTGDLFECAGNAPALCSNPLTTFASDSAGAFTKTVNVSRTFAADLGTPVNCAVTPCRIEAESNNHLFFSQHHLTFATTASGGGPSTTLPPAGSNPATGQTAAAAAKCKKKKTKKARKKCRKRARRLPL